MRPCATVPNILKEAGNKHKAESRCSLHEDDNLARTLFYLPQRLNVKAFLCLNGIHRTSRFSANNGPGVLNRNKHFTIKLEKKVKRFILSPKQHTFHLSQPVGILILRGEGSEGGTWS